MESNTDSYLHKKFKKQLSIESKPLNHERKSKSAAGIVESGEEKILRPVECNKIVDNEVNTKKDNNESVPNQSTNNQSSSFAQSFVKSSISVEKCIANLQSSTTCISYVVSTSRNEDHPRPASFDTEPNNQTVSTSSILDNVYSNKPSYIKSSEDISPQKDHFSEDSEKTDPQPPPDKGAGGKYICPYCSLVCSKPSVLQKHIRAHTNERPYPCNSCGFSFKTRSNLYKHCRSRTHANRVMGNKAQEISNEATDMPNESRSPGNNDSSTSEERTERSQDLKSKPYKPRFHTTKFFSTVIKENYQEEKYEDSNVNSKHANSDLLSHHINEIINKNNSIVNSGDPYLIKKRSSEGIIDNNEYVQRHRTDWFYNNVEEPLNLTNKNRKRSMSEVVEPVAQKSLIKELLLKNLNSDMQCPHCKMIFQTVTELELHKLRSCRGFVKPGAKYSRSSSVNVASILTQNKNAFDDIPQLQNAVFSLKSPGPFLGKTRLVESDKNKSFSFDCGLPADSLTPTEGYGLMSPLAMGDREKKTPVKMFGGEVKITHTTGETKSFKIDSKEGGEFGCDNNYVEYSGKVSENRVVKSGLQSGGTVLTNKASYPKPEPLGSTQDVIRVYDNTSVSPSLDISNYGKTKFSFDRPDLDRNMSILQPHVNQTSANSSPYKYPNMMDFSQKAVKLLTPNLKQPNLAVPGVPIPNKYTFTPHFRTDSRSPAHFDKLSTEPENLSKNAGIKITNCSPKFSPPKPVATQPTNLYNPMNLLVDGKVVRYVPGIPGPVAAEEPRVVYSTAIVRADRPRKLSPLSKTLPTEPNLVMKETRIASFAEKTQIKASKMESLEVRTDFPPLKSPEIRSPKPAEKSPGRITEMKSPTITETKKFARPNSLALKPTTASLKQHHGLTPTMFNQILISPDTPRVAKKYAHQFLHGNYFSYLGLKSSTKPVYCTLNKTQPFYVPHFKKLSMYSEWRQQDTKTDKFYVSSYDSRQKLQRYTTAGRTSADSVVHSSYKVCLKFTNCNLIISIQKRC